MTMWRLRDPQQWSSSPEIYRLIGEKILKQANRRAQKGFCSAAEPCQEVQRIMAAALQRLQILEHFLPVLAEQLCAGAVTLIVSAFSKKSLL